MNPYIQEFTEIIRNGSMENTYKMSWARALVELCVKDPQKHLIEFKDIGKLMFQYYWDLYEFLLGQYIYRETFYLIYH